MTEHERMMTSVLLMTLHQLDDGELAALNLAIQRYSNVPPENMSFQKAVNLKLIKEDGSLWDAELLRTACAIEVNDRCSKKDTA